MRTLTVKLDRIAHIRQLRDSLEPDPVAAAVICELYGADSVSVRLHSQQASIQPRDIKLLRQTVQTHLNLEISNRPNFITLAQKYQPDSITIIPAFHEANIIQNGLKINPNLKETINNLRENGFDICILIDPDPLQIKQALKLDIQSVEICAGNFALLKTKSEIDKEFRNIQKSAELLQQAKVHCAIGHGLDYKNIRYLAKIKEINEFKIGYALISRALFTGLDKAVKDIRNIIDSN